MSENKIGSYDFAVEPFQMDFTGHLTIGLLGNHMLNSAGFHADERGFGMAAIGKDNYIWVLSRLAIEIERMPRLHDRFSIQTWIENVYRLFTNRNFAVTDDNGQAIGYARSVWAMIDMNTRKPVDLLSVNGGSICNYISDNPCPIDKLSHIKVHDGKIAYSMKVRYGDIDMNGHMNSIRYIEHILDLFPTDMYKEKGIRRFEIAYVAESFYGDVLSFYVEQDENQDIYGVEIQNDNSGTVCRAKIRFC